ncbi:MAG TPA: shikimate kinase [Streptosporangiaceae bacterium]
MIVLVGFMGAGKSTVGRQLARTLGLPFTDADQAIEEQAGQPIREIFATAGEEAFRDLEREVITGLLTAPEDAVLALGGGAVETAAIRAALAGHQVVFLQISLDEALARVGHDTGRPLLGDPDLAGLFARRQDRYAAVAAITVRVGADRTAAEVSGETIRRLRPGCGPVS